MGINATITLSWGVTKRYAHLTEWISTADEGVFNILFYWATLVQKQVYAERTKGLVFYFILFFLEKKLHWL